MVIPTFLSGGPSLGYRFTSSRVTMQMRRCDLLSSSMLGVRSLLLVGNGSYFSFLEQCGGGGKENNKAPYSFDDFHKELISALSDHFLVPLE